MDDIIHHRGHQDQTFVHLYMVLSHIVLVHHSDHVEYMLFSLPMVNTERNYGSDQRDNLKHIDLLKESMNLQFLG